MLGIGELLDRLSALYSQREALDAEKQALVDQVITPEVKARLAEIEVEFSQKHEAANANIEALETSIKSETLALGENAQLSFPGGLEQAVSGTRPSPAATPPEIRLPARRGLRHIHGFAMPADRRLVGTCLAWLRDDRPSAGLSGGWSGHIEPPFFPGSGEPLVGRSIDVDPQTGQS
jgi:hypothetical protein